MAGNIASAARDVVQGAVNAAKSALGIKSPSRVFMAIGTQTGQGLAIGLEGMAGPVADAAADMVANAAPKADLLDGLTAGAIGGLAGRVGLDVQAKYDAMSTRLPTLDQATAGAPADRVEALLERLIASVEAGQVIALDGEKLVGATTRRMSHTLATSQQGASRANGAAGKVVV